MLLFAIFIFASRPSTAAVPFRLAFSEKLAAQVFANVDGDGRWCGPKVSISILIGDNSPLLVSGLAEFVTRIGPLLEEKCPSAIGARVAVYRDGDRSLVGSMISITKAAKWLPADPPKTVSPPATQPDAAAPALTQLANGAGAKPGDDQSGFSFRLPQEMDFQSVLLQMVRRDRSLADDQDVLRYWASVHHQHDYNQVADQEFKLQPLLRQTRGELLDAAENAENDIVTVRLTISLSPYDFSRQRFPFKSLGQALDINKLCCVQSSKLPGTVTVQLADLNSLTGLVMAERDAEAFIARRSQSVAAANRTVALYIRLKLAPEPFGLINFGRLAITGSILEAAFSNPNDTQIVAHIPPEGILALRAEREARVTAEQQELAAQRVTAQRHSLEQQREFAISTLARAPVSVRLANFISPSFQVQNGLHLDSIAEGRGRAIVARKPIETTLLIQAEDSGRDNVDTRWPGKLKATIPGDQPALKSGKWYLLQGWLTVPAGDDLPAAQLAVTRIYECSAERCNDATEPKAIIEHKLALLSMPPNPAQETGR